MKRLTDRPFPAYAHEPGKTPHPERDPDGHSYGVKLPETKRLTEENWQTHEQYLYGIDLFNHAFYWEAHEVWESIWKLHHRREPTAIFLQGFIQLAAARIKGKQGNETGKTKLEKNAVEKFAKLATRCSMFMGIGIAPLIEMSSEMEFQIHTK